MSNTRLFHEALNALASAPIIHNGSHIVIVIPDDAWKHIYQNSFACANLSMQSPLPVNIVTEDGTMSVWWTNGIKHNPFGPSENLMGKGFSVMRYNDKDGFTHRDDGPATMEKDFDGSYLETWMIRPGIYHREGGPALIENVVYTPRIKTWKMVAAENYFLPNNKFKDDTPVRCFDHRKKSWIRHGRPFNVDGRYNETVEDDAYVVSLLTPTLIPKVFTFIKNYRYRWYNESGNLDRTNGPASVILHNVVMVDEGNRKTSFNWDGHTDKWYHKGNSIEKFALEKWINKHGIKQHKGPAVAHGSFINPDDEFCFITDFLPGVAEYGNGPF